MEHNSSKMSCIIRMIFSVQTVKIKIVYFVGARRGNAITAKLEIKYLLRNERALQEQDSYLIIRHSVSEDFIVTHAVLVYSATIA